MKYQYKIINTNSNNTNNTNHSYLQQHNIIKLNTSHIIPIINVKQKYNDNCLLNRDIEPHIKVFLEFYKTAKFGNN